MTKYCEIRAVTFDGDGTLWDFELSAQIALAEAAQIVSVDLGRKVSPEDLARSRSAVAGRPELANETMESIRRLSFIELYGGVDSDPALVENVYSKFMEARFSNLRVYDDVYEALPRLADRVPLGYISNGNTHLDRVGLSEYFEIEVLGQEVGVRKPDPAIYLHAAERLSVSPQYILHVGDNVVEDVESAGRAGYQTVLIERNSNIFGRPSLQRRSISSLREILL